MVPYPLLELPDGARAVAAPREHEYAVLHRLACRAPAIAARAQLTDAVLFRVPLAPELVGFCITSVVRCRWRYWRRDDRTRHGVGGWLSARLSRHQRYR